MKKQSNPVDESQAGQRKARAHKWGKGPGDVLADGKAANHPDRGEDGKVRSDKAREVKPNSLFR